MHIIGLITIDKLLYSEWPHFCYVTGNLFLKPLTKSVNLIEKSDKLLLYVVIFVKMQSINSSFPASN